MPQAAETMRAVVLTGHGGLDRLEYREGVSRPEPGPGEVRIRVGASAVNNTDINTRTAWYVEDVTTGITDEGGAGGFEAAEGQSSGWSGAPIDFPRIQGADVCGRIDAVGQGVDTARIGERVIVDGWLRDPEHPGDVERAGYLGSERDGGFAEYVTVPVENAHAIDSELSDAELASFPCAWATAENLVSRPYVGDGDTVLITGASGGVGSAAIQLCRRRGATVVALSSTAKHPALRELGAHAVIDRDSEEVAGDVARALGREGVNVVLDPVCGARFGELIGLLRREGRYASCGAIAGPIVTFDARHLIYRDLEFFGATVLPSSVFANLVGYIERGEVRPVVSRRFPLSQLREAQEAFLAKRDIGKIVIDVAGED
jgi:NADPH:quinone reductase-like Zn-dependent oxidoreductase